MPAEPVSATSTSTLPPEMWDNQVASLPETAHDWLVPGFLARGNMTLLTSMWKAGKTTLLAHLLAHRVNSQPLLGRAVAPGKSVVISEEPRSMWADRCRQFAFGGQLCLMCQPFAHLPSAEEWRGLMKRVAELHTQQGIDLLVIDSLTHFLRAENAVEGVQGLLMPVRELTAQGMAGLLMHHPRRQGASAGNAGRGHGSIHTEVDISIEMRHAGDNLESRARRFFCLSRHADTPKKLLFELDADGADYTVLPEADDDGFSAQWEVLRMVLEDAPQKVTCLDILAEWPDDFARPSETHLRNWLKSAVSAGLVLIEGSGRKADPYRYWVAAAEARWRENPLYEMFKNNARDMGLPFVSLRERKRACAENEREERRSGRKKDRLWPPGAAEE